MSGRPLLPWRVMVNPAAADGRTGRRWKAREPLLRRILPDFEVYFTEGPGHAVVLGRRAAEEGVPVLAVHGGDGTINEAVNGLLSVEGPLPALAVLPGGTGADWVRSSGIPHSLAAAAHVARNGSPRPMDLGRVQFLHPDGRRMERYFANVADVGFGGELVRYVNGRSKRWGGRITFFQGLIRTLFNYGNKEMEILLDEGERLRMRTCSVVVANGQFFGGGMWVAPQARVDDGFLEVVVIGDVTKTEFLTHLGLLYRGTIARHPKVRTFRAKTVALHSDDEVWIDADGEEVGLLPARFEILPEKICLIR
jgi:diacylglycerol kinase (ATP)